MKSTVNIKLNGVNYQLTVNFKRGEYGRYLNSCEKGEYRNYVVSIDKKETHENELFYQTIIKVANDKSSCHGNWYAHCNGYAKDAILNYRNELTINTYAPYNK